MVVAWMGGSRPKKFSDCSVKEKNLVSYLFRDQVAAFNLFWGDMPEMDIFRIYWKRARYDAHATLRDRDAYN